MKKEYWQRNYLALDRYAAIKLLETPYVYNIRTDNLYEIDDMSVRFLSMCDGTKKGEELTEDKDSVLYLISEGIIRASKEPCRIDTTPAAEPVPSLRYLELQLTARCNLKCGHCYLGAPQNKELPLEDAVKIAREFSDMGGLRLIISGGEPMLYPHLKEFLEMTKELKVRRVLLTNGTLIDKNSIEWLDVEEIQFSMDGWKKGHDMLRGEGTFDRMFQGVARALSKKIPLSFSTMIHRENLGEFESMESAIKTLDAVEWGIDVMCPSGNLLENEKFAVPYEEAAQYLKYSFGGGYHGQTDGYACGRHLMTVMADGTAVKCGFYADAPLGDARDGLRECWLKLEQIPVERLECAGCAVINECAGGCRFRAPRPLAPDPVMCAFYGVKV